MDVCELDMTHVIHASDESEDEDDDRESSQDASACNSTSRLSGSFTLPEMPNLDYTQAGGSGETEPCGVDGEAKSSNGTAEAAAPVMSIGGGSNADVANDKDAFLCAPILRFSDDTQKGKPGDASALGGVSGATATMQPYISDTECSQESCLKCDRVAIVEADEADALDAPTQGFGDTAAEDLNAVILAPTACASLDEQERLNAVTQSIDDCRHNEVDTEYNFCAPTQPRDRLRRLLSRPCDLSFVLCEASQPCRNGEEEGDGEYCPATKKEISLGLKVHALLKHVKEKCRAAVDDNGDETPPSTLKTTVDETPPSLVADSDPEDYNVSMVTALPSLFALISDATFYEDCTTPGSAIGSPYINIFGRLSAKRRGSGMFLRKKQVGDAMFYEDCATPSSTIGSPYTNIFGKRSAKQRQSGVSLRKKPSCDVVVEQPIQEAAAGAEQQQESVPLKASRKLDYAEQAQAGDGGSGAAERRSTTTVMWLENDAQECSNSVADNASCSLLPSPAKGRSPTASTDPSEKDDYAPYLRMSEIEGLDVPAAEEGDSSGPCRHSANSVTAEARRQASSSAKKAYSKIMMKRKELAVKASLRCNATRRKIQESSLQTAAVLAEVTPREVDESRAVQPRVQHWLTRAASRAHRARKKGTKKAAPEFEVLSTIPETSVPSQEDETVSDPCAPKTFQRGIMRTTKPSPAGTDTTAGNAEEEDEKGATGSQHRSAGSQQGQSQKTRRRGGRNAAKASSKAKQKAAESKVELCPKFTSVQPPKARPSRCQASNIPAPAQAPVTRKMDARHMRKQEGEALNSAASAVSALAGNTKGRPPPKEARNKRSIASMSFGESMQESNDDGTTSNEEKALREMQIKSEPKSTRKAAVKETTIRQEAVEEPRTNQGKRKENLPDVIPVKPQRSRSKENAGASSLITTRILKRKPKVLFTGLDCTNEGEQVVRELGGVVATSASACTHLVTDKFRRTVKLLCCIGKGTPIVDVSWIKKCQETKAFIDHAPYLLQDKKAEKLLNFSLSEALAQAATHGGMLRGWSIHATARVQPSPPDMKEIVTCAGGKYLDAMPTRSTRSFGNTVIVSCKDDAKACARAKDYGVPVVSAEFLLSGLLLCKVDVDAYRLRYK